ncbi:MAG: hypothetical protein A2W35_06425 [Chloroflexi bacterium RBG_16_57_11]|nr:MAG: hypothetical protein A2W35_06425 [Chloroflexi bacterium RBG_16_57_11]
MSDTIDVQIQQAIGLANSGNKVEARKLLAQAVQKEPSNARAWYLLSQVVENEEQGIYCLEQVLKVQPGNPQATERLEKLRPKTEQVFEELPGLDKPEISPSLPQDATISIKRTPKQKEQRYLILGLAIAFIWFVGAITFWVNNGKARNKPAVIPAMPSAESIQNWVIYEVKYVNIDENFSIRYHGSADMTWENNTGGTEQGTYRIGDGQSHTYKSYSGKTVTEQKHEPFRAAYQMRPGDFAYISAQSDESYNRLICSIYVADKSGETCLVHSGTTCGKIALWKTAQCSGQFCICSASGIFGIP